MRLKSYFVYTMEEAIQAAKVELGEDAMLVNSKRLEAPEGERILLEVIFAATAPPPPPPKIKSPSLHSRLDSNTQIQQFRGELRTLLDALSRTPDGIRLEALSPARAQLDELRGRLLTAEVPPLVVDEMLSRCRPVLERITLRGDVQKNGSEDAVAALLAAELRCAPESERGTTRTIAFVGPPGAGKTTAIAKLAFRLGILQARPARVFSLDNLRIGASDQLAHLCSLLGIPFQTIGFGAAVHQAISTTSQQGFVLIDTPGYGPADADVVAEMAQQLQKVESLQCHLVLPATMRFDEMQRKWRQFEALTPSRVLFTRLDETEYFGPAWAFARASRLSADWVSTGPRIPEDIEDADASLAASALLGKRAKNEGRVNAPVSNLASAAIAGASRI